MHGFRWRGYLGGLLLLANGALVQRAWAVADIEGNPIIQVARKRGLLRMPVFKTDPTDNRMLAPQLAQLQHHLRWGELKNLSRPGREAVMELIKSLHDAGTLEDVIAGRQTVCINRAASGALNEHLCVHLPGDPELPVLLRILDAIGSDARPQRVWHEITDTSRSEVQAAGADDPSEVKEGTIVLTVKDWHNVHEKKLDTETQQRTIEEQSRNDHQIVELSIDSIGGFLAGTLEENHPSYPANVKPFSDERTYMAVLVSELVAAVALAAEEAGGVGNLPRGEGTLMQAALHVTDEDIAFGLELASRALFNVAELGDSARSAFAQFDR